MQWIRRFSRLAAGRYSTMSRQGEDVVRRLVHLASERNMFCYRSRAKDGKLNDSSTGKAGEEKFYANSNPEFTRHYKDGQLYDSKVIFSTAT